MSTMSLTTIARGIVIGAVLLALTGWMLKCDHRRMSLGPVDDVVEAGIARQDPKVGEVGFELSRIAHLSHIRPA